MQAVVIDRLQGEPAALAKTAAKALGLTAYEVTASMNVPEHGPAVLAVLADLDEAQAYAAALRLAGFESTVISVRDAISGLHDFLVRSFEFGSITLHVEDRQGRSRDVAYADVDLLIRATRVTAEKDVRIVRKREFSLASAIVSGGLINTRVKETKHSTTKVDADELLFVYLAGEPCPIAFDHSDLLYQALGASMQPSRAANFVHLVTTLRNRCPGAQFDERLRQRSIQSQTLGRTLNPDSHLDFAIALVAASKRHPTGSPFRRPDVL
jgi:hypothetical protein